MLLLSEDITALKLQALQDKHQIMFFQENRRRLEATIASHGAMLITADCARVEAETRLLLGDTETANAIKKHDNISISNDKIESCVSMSCEMTHVPASSPIDIRSCQCP